MTNNGGFTIDVGGALSGAGTYAQTAGTTTVNGTFAQSDILISGGSLGGTGQITGNVTVAAGGAVGPGNSPGDLTIDGGFTLGSMAVLSLELGGTGIGDFDRLFVTGEADLLGLIQISFIDGFLPSANDAFTLLTVGSFTKPSSQVSFSFLGGEFDSFVANFTATTLSIVFEEDIAPVPVPAALPMLLLGLIGLYVIARKRKQSFAAAA